MNHYEKEKLDFEMHFKDFREKRIVLYGIGRFTATLVSMLDGWNIVGLMDRNPEKIGTYIYGLPILCLKEAENKADLIIINTSRSYWDAIYQRIMKARVPVYFRNGEKAEFIDFAEEISYWNYSYEQLKALIDEHEIISFDFFDTLFCRKLYMASEIWEYVGDSLHDSYDKKEFLRARRSAYANIKDKIPNIYDIYKNILIDMHKDRETLMQDEIKLENMFIIPRQQMVSLLKYAIKEEKEVYIISDMYLESDFFIKVLKKYGINLKNEKLWISCECGCTKEKGIWQKFQNDVIKNRSALHIGDDWEKDIKNCERYTKADTFFVMSKDEMMQKSSIRMCLEHVFNSYHSIVLGLCEAKLFNDPFALCETKGKVRIIDRKDFGYIVFGPVIFSFVFWLTKMIEKDGISHLCFLGRDGFFLKRNFEYLCDLLNMQNELRVSYLETSRQILMCSGIENENDFVEYIKMPYEGKMDEFFEDRFQIAFADEEKSFYSNTGISMPYDYGKVRKILDNYGEEIENYIKNTKNNYKKYLEAFSFSNNTAIVDLGFYGTTQHYLSKILGKEFIGYYVVANNLNDNILAKKHILKSCTCIKTDKSCNKSNIHSMGLAIESFLTSPHGMVKSILSDEKFVFSADTNNQIFFADKMEINEGIQLFIKDMVELHWNRLNNMNIYIDDFIDNWYGIVIKNSVYSENVKRSFYNDNAFIHRRQERIFDN